MATAPGKHLKSSVWVVHPGPVRLTEIMNYTQTMQAGTGRRRHDDQRADWRRMKPGEC